jgi:hypothetical protein
MCSLGYASSRIELGLRLFSWYLLPEIHVLFWIIRCVYFHSPKIKFSHKTSLWEGQRERERERERERTLGIPSLYLVCKDPLFFLVLLAERWNCSWSFCSLYLIGSALGSKPVDKRQAIDYIFLGCSQREI